MPRHPIILKHGAAWIALVVTCVAVVCVAVLVGQVLGDAGPSVAYVAPGVTVPRAETVVPSVTPPPVPVFSIPVKPTTILFVGDIMLDRLVATRMKNAKDPFYPFLGLKDEAGRFFRGQDLVVANLEGPVTPTRRPPDKSLDFAFATSVVPVLKAVGIHAVSQANNHALDQGREGADESRTLLMENGLTVFGDQVRDNATSSLAVVEVNGERIALLGWNTTDNPLNRDDARAAIAAATSTASRVIVFMHWGEEYKEKPSKAQTDLAHWFIDHGGISAVVGAHPHWTQSVEVYKNKPIVYSLGNFIFDQDWSVETTHGLAVKFSFGKSESMLHLYPVQIVKSQPRFLLGEEKIKRLEHLASISDPVLTNAIREGMIAF